MRLAFLILIHLALAVPGLAQDRAGRNTPGEWVVTHYAPFDLWDSICDGRKTAGVLEERCYLRYVDVFSPRPRFAAMFAFVSPKDGVTEVEFGTERGTRFADGGFRIDQAGRTVWAAPQSCLRRRQCTWTGAKAGALLAIMSDGGAFRFDFTDRHGTTQALAWDLTRFVEALADHRREATRRGLF